MVPQAAVLLIEVALLLPSDGAGVAAAAVDDASVGVELLAATDINRLDVGAGVLVKISPCTTRSSAY